VNQKRKSKPTASPRPFQTDYAGAWRGHCKTRESAIIAAAKHLVNDGYSRATVTNIDTNQDIARLRLSADRLKVVIEVVKPFKVINPSLRRIK
jgi:hypothetical protein